MRKPNKRLTEPEWRRVRKRVCAGESVCLVAGEFGITPATVWRRKKIDGWEVKETTLCDKAGLERTQKQANLSDNFAPDPPNLSYRPAQDPPKLSDNSRPDLSDNSEQDPDNQPLTNLIEIAQTSPERFQEAVGAYLEQLMAQGIADIPPPRTISELAKLNSIIRQTRGLDSKTATGGLFDPVRPLRRTTGNIVDADSVRPSSDDLLDGFEV